jgi:hypothetical protein
MTITSWPRHFLSKITPLQKKSGRESRRLYRMIEGLPFFQAVKTFFAGERM